MNKNAEKNSKGVTEFQLAVTLEINKLVKSGEIDKAEARKFLDTSKKR